MEIQPTKLDIPTEIKTPEAQLKTWAKLSKMLTVVGNTLKWDPHCKLGTRRPTFVEFQQFYSLSLTGQTN
jgi:hypothetical protein